MASAMPPVRSRSSTPSPRAIPARASSSAPPRPDGCSNAPSAPPFELDDRPCDTGVVQIDSLRLDAAATIREAAAFHATLDARADEEARAPESLAACVS